MLPTVTIRSGAGEGLPTTKDRPPIRGAALRAAGAIDAPGLRDRLPRSDYLALVEPIGAVEPVDFGSAGAG